MKQPVLLACMIALILSGTACRELNARSSESSVSQGTGVSIGDPDDSAGFWVKACRTFTGSSGSGTCDEGNYLIHQRSSATLGTNPVADRLNECKITNADGSAAAMIECLVEADELELAFNGLSLAYNVPSSMCEYFVENPFHFWNYEPALAGADRFGPSVVSYTISAAGTITSVATQTYVGAVLTPDAVAQVAVNSNGAGIRCLYNYSDSGGPNCCSGTYQLTVTNLSVTPNTVVTSFPSWGGSGANCLAGPAMRTQSKSEDGYPIVNYFNVEGTGISRGYTAVSRSSGSILVNTAFTANHVKTLNLASAASYPKGFSTRAGYSPVPYYEFLCLDRAEEVNARVRVYVREWNEVGELDKYRNGDASANEDTSGTETGSGGVKNDRADWEDIHALDVFPSSEAFLELSSGTAPLGVTNKTEIPDYLLRTSLY